MGKEFDALIIDTAAPHGDPVLDVFDDDTEEVIIVLAMWISNYVVYRTYMYTGKGTICCKM